MSYRTKQNIFELSMYIYMFIIFYKNLINYFTIAIGISGFGLILFLEIKHFIKENKEMSK